ncbi:hypothetical protein NDI85_03975 [Halomicroarcula sp. S1AR25-4]|uniref:hypothetical protein n=1 Tax=Haloarcula sp. S1AR25-4 TaxID=2950538 RepID=UPI002876A11A|nr:hypothetical protein [Halomicroarcula sp. S1AR25-4]MDS0276936.1 hypothetical protein [Halomicroarcula sp. S1AR25-4]
MSLFTGTVAVYAGVARRVSSTIASRSLVLTGPTVAGWVSVTGLFVTLTPVVFVVTDRVGADGTAATRWTTTE